MTAGGGGGRNLRSTRLNFNTTMKDRSADAATAIQNSHKSLNGPVQNHTDAWRKLTTKYKKPYDYAANSVFTPTRLPGGGIIYAAYNKDKVQRQIDRAQAAVTPTIQADDKARVAAQQARASGDTNAINRANAHWRATSAARAEAEKRANTLRNNLNQAQSFVNQRVGKNIGLTGTQYGAIKDNVLPGSKGVKVRQVASGTRDKYGDFKDTTWNNTVGANQYVAERRADRMSYNFDNWDENTNSFNYSPAAQTAWTRRGDLRSSARLGPGKQWLDWFYNTYPQGTSQLIKSVGRYAQQLGKRDTEDYRAYTQHPYVFDQFNAPAGTRQYFNRLNYFPQQRQSVIQNGVNQLLAEADPTKLDPYASYDNMY